MKFTKPSLSIDELVELLLDRGMSGDAGEMKRRLASVHYYRLSAYWHTFRCPDKDAFLPNTQFNVAWERYVFDRKLRLIVMDAIERFEVAARARLTHQHALRGDPFQYVTPGVLFKNAPSKREEFLRRLQKDVGQNKHLPFVRHFISKYGDEHPYPPVWVAVEVLSFGGIVSLYNGSEPAIQKAVAKSFGVPARVLTSWLLSLNAVRNICAHHGRLWNRQFGLRPLIPRTKEWAEPVQVTNDKTFAILTILAFALQNLSKSSGWAHRLQNLLASHPSIPLQQMGFPKNWKSSAVWRKAWAEL